MLSMRVATILSPALGGLLIAGMGVGWVYLLTALGTGLTVLTLLGLPRMMPQGEAGENPLRAMAQAFAFLAGHKVILSVVALGCLTTVATSIRILFPALVEEVFGGGAFETGLMYSAVPIGATLGAALSGWAARLERPGLVMGGACMGAFACVAVIGAAGSLPNGFYVALPLLVLFGYATSIASLLEYSMVQGHTPDRLLGRVNSLWTAQDVFGDSAGTIGMGLLATLLSPAVGILALGLGALALAAAVTAAATAMRGAPMSDPALEGTG